MADRGCGGALFEAPFMNIDCGCKVSGYKSAGGSL